MRQLHLFIVLLLITAGTALQAQVANMQNLDNTILRQRSAPVEMGGSPYLHDDWSTGAMQMTDGKVYTNVSLRYNIYRDLLEIRMDGQELEVAPATLEAFSYQQDKQLLTFKRGFAGHETYQEKAYFQVLFESDEITLLKKARIDIYNSATPGYNSGQADTGYSRSDNYFVYKDGEILEVGKSKKDFLEVVSDKGSEMKSYIKDEKLKLRKEADMKQLLRHYSGA